MACPKDYGTDEERRAYINSHMSQLHPVMKKLREVCFKLYVNA